MRTCFYTSGKATDIRSQIFLGSKIMRREVSKMWFLQKLTDMNDHTLQKRLVKIEDDYGYASISNKWEPQENWIFRKIIFD